MIVCTKFRVLEVEMRDGKQIVSKAEPLEVSFGCHGNHPAPMPLVPGDVFYLTTVQDVRTHPNVTQYIDGGPGEAE